MKNSLIQVIDKTAVISAYSLAKLLELDINEFKMSLSDNEDTLKHYGNIIIDKTNDTYGMYLNERQTYRLLTDYNDIPKLNYIKRTLLNDFFHVQKKLLKKKQSKELKKHIKSLTNLI